MTQHRFEAKLHWEKLNDSEKGAVRQKFKNHKIHIEGKETLNISAAKQFKGDPNLVNPEDLLLSSLMSCHMMSYLYVCSKHDVEVNEYQDEGEAILELNNDGSGRIIKAVLKPRVKVGKVEHEILAYQLHEEARKLCFIANSCNFQVDYLPVVHSFKI